MALASASLGMKRFVAVSCSHGYLADRKAQDAVIAFCRDFKPHTTIHLGDFTDTTAFSRLESTHKSVW